MSKSVEFLDFDTKRGYQFSLGGEAGSLEAGNMGSNLGLALQSGEAFVEAEFANIMLDVARFNMFEELPASATARLIELEARIYNERVFAADMGAPQFRLTPKLDEAVCLAYEPLMVDDVFGPLLKKARDVSYGSFSAGMEWARPTTKVRGGLVVGDVALGGYDAYAAYRDAHPSQKVPRAAASVGSTAAGTGVILTGALVGGPWTAVPLMVVYGLGGGEWVEDKLFKSFYDHPSESRNATLSVRDPSKYYEEWDALRYK